MCALSLEKRRRDADCNPVLQCHSRPHPRQRRRAGESREQLRPSTPSDARVLLHLGGPSWACAGRHGPDPAITLTEQPWFSWIQLKFFLSLSWCNSLHLKKELLFGDKTWSSHLITTLLLRGRSRAFRQPVLTDTKKKKKSYHLENT